MHKKDNEPNKYWDLFSTWEEAEASWDRKAQEAASRLAIKNIAHPPQIPSITPSTRKGLFRKSIAYLLRRDSDRLILRTFLKRPIHYSFSLLKSVLKKSPYQKSEDLYLYGVHSSQEWLQRAQQPNSLLIVGFSYCHKPLECPSGRFNDSCIHDLSHPVCKQCFIGKAYHASPSCHFFIIPTVLYIGEKVVDLMRKNPSAEISFLISACPLSLEMFSHFGNMLRLKGIGISLGGRICNTFQAFVLAEEGIKPGLTVVSNKTQSEILRLFASLKTAPKAPQEPKI